MTAPELDPRQPRTEGFGAEASAGAADAVAPDPGAPGAGPQPAMKASQAVSMAVCVAFGFAYFGWVAFTEGWRFWLVASLVATFATLGWVAHRVMAAGRRR
ncbi:MAG TPA: hypothetical protein VMS86_09460 [Thermoanaerobaculia bacterium]|nr:hypothetical protein [Thermoanaerobaculia bacterium]